MAHRTLFLGLDAADWPALDPLLAAGRLPTIQALIARGSVGTLRSTLPAWTPTAWASIVTGKQPGKHGVWGMVARQPGSYDFVPTTSRHRRGSPVWQRLNEGGLRVGLVNIPFLHPIEPLDGFAVAGFGTPNEVADWAYPAEAQAHIRAQWPDFRPAIEREIYQSASPEAIYQAERLHQRQQVEVALSLAARYPVEVLALNLMLADHANHYMPTMAQVEQALCDCDHDIARLLDGFAPDEVLLFSDHGSRRLKGQFLLHQWLCDAGYSASAPRPPAERAAALNWLLAQWLQGALALPAGAAWLLRVALRAVLPHLPAAWAAPLWDKIEAQVPFARYHAAHGRQTDFERAALFPHSPFAGLLYLNRTERDPQGTVPPDAAAALLAELRARLLALADPDTGEPLMQGCYQPSELYEGVALADAPDLILDHYDSPWWLLETPLDSQPYHSAHRYFAPNLGQYGAHRRDGLFVLAGPSAAPGAAPTLGHVVDLPATLLYLHGLPIPEDYDGTVLLSALEPTRVAQQPRRTQPGDAARPAAAPAAPYSAEESDELMARLRALGYVS